MSYSELTTLYKQAANYHPKRWHRIDRITVHCYVGQVSCATAAACFARDRSDKASANYTCCIDGIACHMDDTSWSNCSSSSANDNRAITIETACDAFYPYAVRDDVYERLIALITDCCIRNGIKRVTWIPDKALALAYTPAEGEAIFTWHCFFANKACPGQWLKEHQEDIKNQVNERLEDYFMTGEEIYNKLVEYLNKQTGSDWAKADWNEATLKKITDGTAPQRFCSREETIALINRTIAKEKTNDDVKENEDEQ